jgi:HAD superfamily hydrolase (TIGR01509 family)
MGSVAAVLFDLGGTLFGYDRRDAMGRPATVALTRMGLSPDDPDVVAARREAYAEVESEYAARSSFLHRDLFRERVDRTARMLGLTASATVLDRFDAENRQAIIDNLVPRDDARATLEALRARGIQTWVVSNADDDYLVPLLTQHRFDEILDGWTSSEEAASCKPDPRIYEYALAKAGTRPDETLFVGDSLEHDIAGAHAARMRTVLIGEPGSTAPLSHGLVASVDPEFAIRELVEVLAVVDGLNAGH